MNLKSFLAQPDAQAVAVCDVDPVNLHKARDLVNARYDNTDCMTTQDFREILARADIDAVMISTPDHWHVPISIAAARAGKDVECEKPTLTVEEGRRLVQTMQRYGRVFQWSTEDRSVDVYHRMCELVRNGRIGKVTRVEVGLPSGGATGNPPVSPVPEGLDWDFWLGPAPWRPFTKYGGNAPHWDWRWIMDYSGGQLTDWAGHHIDIAHWGLGLEDTGPVEIEGEGVFPKDGIYDVPTEYKFTCKYANGVEMIVASDRLVPKGMGAVWYGDKGWIHVDRGRQATNPPELWNEKIGPGEMRLYESRDHQQNFLDCVKTRKKTITPIEVAYRSISVGHLGEIAMLLGRKIHWDPDKQVFVNDDAANRMLSRPMRAPWHL